MPFVNVKELHDRTSEILREVAKGDPVFITRYGKPVAVIPDLTDEELEGFIMFSHPSFRKDLDAARADVATGRVSALDALIAKTGEGLK